LVPTTSVLRLFFNNAEVWNAYGESPLANWHAMLLVAESRVAMVLKVCWLLSICLFWLEKTGYLQTSETGSYDVRDHLSVLTGEVDKVFWVDHFADTQRLRPRTLLDRDLREALSIGTCLLNIEKEVFDISMRLVSSWFVTFYGQVNICSMTTRLFPGTCDIKTSRFISSQ